jgi:hypothetical protein
VIKMLSADDKVAEIKRLYYQTSRTTIKQDVAKAIQLLKSMASDEERERVAVYMDGLSQMRSDWARQERNPMPTKKRKKEQGRRNKA